MIVHPLAAWDAVARHGSVTAAGAAYENAVARRAEPAQVLWAQAVELATYIGFRGPHRTGLLRTAGQLVGEPLTEADGWDVEDLRLSEWTRRLVDDRRRAGVRPQLIGDALCAAGDLAGAEAAYSAARDEESDARQARVLTLQTLLCRQARRGGTGVRDELEAWTAGVPELARPNWYEVMALCALADARREVGDAHGAIAGAGHARSGARALHARTLEALAVAIQAEAYEQQGERVSAQRAARDSFQLADSEKTLNNAQIHVFAVAAWAQIAHRFEDRTGFAYPERLNDAVGMTWVAVPRGDALSHARLSVAAAQIEERGRGPAELALAAFSQAMDELASDPDDVRWALVAQASGELIDEQDPPPGESAALTASVALATATGGRGLVTALAWARTAEALERRRHHPAALYASDQALKALPVEQVRSGALDDPLAAAIGRCALQALLRGEAVRALELLVPTAMRDVDRFRQRAITAETSGRAHSLIAQRERQGVLAAALVSVVDHPDDWDAEVFARGVEALLAAKGLLRDAADAELALARLSGRRPSLDATPAAQILAAAADALTFADEATVRAIMNGTSAPGLLNRLMDACGADRLLVDLIVVPDAAPPGRPRNAIDHYYLAIVVWDGGCAVLMLGSQEEVDIAVGAARDVLMSPSAGDARQRSIAARLDATLLGEVRQALPGAVGDRQDWVVGLDGAANFAPLGVAGVLGEAVLSEGTTLHLTESLRRWADSRSPESDAAPVVIGGPDYRSGVGAETPVRWPGLPDALREAEDVARLWDVSPITGSAATRSAVLAVRRPRVFHLATHGGLAESGPTVSYRPDAVDIAAVLAHEVHSVIALAGADGGETGTLNAREIAGLDLRGTRLAVLSACDTALGGALVGEEIVGLRHALRTAGAQRVLTSLWRVPDAEAADFMVVLHRGLVDGMSVPAALVAARDQARRSGMAPRVWAAWQLLETHADG